MAPFINGMAIGIALGLLIVCACFLLMLVVFAVRLLWWFATFAVPQAAAGVREGLRESQPRFKQALAEGRENAARIREAGRARREKDLAWMERYWPTRWCARLNRRLLG